MIGPTINSIKCCMIPLSSSNMILESLSKATDLGSICNGDDLDCSLSAWDAESLDNVEPEKSPDFKALGSDDEVGV